MDADHVKYFCELLSPTFVECRGRVFANQRQSDLPRAYKRRAPGTVDENTANHVHFEFFRDDTEEGVRENFTLAETVRLVWREHLRSQFPRRRFRLFVSNEYHNVPTERRPFPAKDECVQTVLRLWSVPADDTGFDDTYHPDATGPGWVLWPEYRRVRLVKLSTVIRLIASRAPHPAKARYLKERWHAI